MEFVVVFFVIGCEVVGVGWYVDGYVGVGLFDFGVVCVDVKVF